MTRLTLISYWSNSSIYNLPYLPYFMQCPFSMHYALFLSLSCFFFFIISFPFFFGALNLITVFYFTLPWVLSFEHWPVLYLPRHLSFTLLISP